MPPVYKPRKSVDLVRRSFAFRGLEGNCEALRWRHIWQGSPLPLANRFHWWHYRLSGRRDIFRRNVIGAGAKVSIVYLRPQNFHRLLKPFLALPGCWAVIASSQKRGTMPSPSPLTLLKLPTTATLIGVVFSMLALITFPSRFASADTAPPPSIGALQAAENNLIANRSAFQQQGMNIQSVMLNNTNNGLIVGLTPGSPNNLGALDSRAPGIPITTQFVRIISANANVGNGPPWLTGTDLYDMQNQGGALHWTECTSGFNVINPKTRQTFVTTAAHCFGQGTHILHADGGIAQPVGPVVASSPYNSNADAELIAPQPGTTPNTILINNNHTAAVSSYYPISGVGTPLCKSGIATGETCGNVVSSTNATVCYSIGCFTGQEQTTNRAQAEAAYLGDSGGPVYAYGPNGSGYRCRHGVGLPGDL